MKIAMIEFSPTTGFGTAGRRAALYDSNGKELGLGSGETDSEAVCEALIAAGLGFDQAFDMQMDLLRKGQTRLVRVYDCPTDQEI